MVVPTNKVGKNPPPTTSHQPQYPHPPLQRAHSTWISQLPVRYPVISSVTVPHCAVPHRQSYNVTRGSNSQRLRAPHYWTHYPLPPCGSRVNDQIYLDQEHPKQELPDLATYHSEKCPQALTIIRRNPERSHAIPTAVIVIHQSPILPIENSTV